MRSDCPIELDATINHERMPVILTQEAEFQQWLKGTRREAYSLVKQYPAKIMRFVQSGPAKKDLLAGRNHKGFQRPRKIAARINDETNAANIDQN